MDQRPLRQIKRAQGFFELASRVSYGNDLPADQGHPTPSGALGRIGQPIDLVARRGLDQGIRLRLAQIKKAAEPAELRMVGKAPERSLDEPSRRRQATDGEELVDGIEDLVRLVVGTQIEPMCRLRPTSRRVCPLRGLGGHRGRGVCSHIVAFLQRFYRIMGALSAS